MADPRRVAARAVGRTPQEHEALEQALAKRRATRLGRPQQQQQQQQPHQRRRRDQRQTKWEEEGNRKNSNTSRNAVNMEPSYERPVIQRHDKCSPDWIRFTSPTATSSTSGRRWAAPYYNAKTVLLLLLVTQIPRGGAAGSDYATLREHVRPHEDAAGAELNFLGSGCRATGWSARPKAGGAGLGRRGHDVELLLTEEGVRIGGGGTTTRWAGRGGGFSGVSEARGEVGVS
ncbi:hypothetical protein Hte_011537 [Hypoxylon texense]